MDNKMDPCLNPAWRKEQKHEGDSGGPMVRIVNKSLILQGITSFGIGCGRENSPGVYTDVSAHRNWIDFNIKRAVKVPRPNPQNNPTNTRHPISGGHMPQGSGGYRPQVNSGERPLGTSGQRPYVTVQHYVTTSEGREVGSRPQETSGYRLPGLSGTSGQQPYVSSVHYVSRGDQGGVGTSGQKPYVYISKQYGSSGERGETGTSGQLPNVGSAWQFSSSSRQPKSATSGQ